MATLSITNNFSLPTSGNTLTGKQGLAASAFATAYDITVNGQVHNVVGSLATATVVTVYDDDDDFPIDWDYCYIWADQALYVQIFGVSLNATFKMAAYQPFVIPGFDSILAAANTTIMTGGVEPTMTDIDSIALGNYSGTTANYLFCVID